MIATKVLARIPPVHWYRDTYVRALRDIPSINNPSFQKLYENLYLDPTAAELRWKAVSQFEDLTGEDAKVAGSFSSLTSLKDGDVDIVILDPIIHGSPSKIADIKAALELREEYPYAASYILSGYHHTIRKEGVHLPTQHPRITKGKIPVMIYKNRENIQLDITVKNPGILETTAYVRNKISKWPPLYPVLLSLKAWLKHRDAGFTFTGGLGSYGLALTLIGYMKMRNPLYENADYRAQRRSDPGYDLIPTQKRDKWRIKKEGEWEALDSKGTFSPDGVAYDLGKLQDEKEETLRLELDPKFLDPYEILLDYLKFWTTEWDLGEWSLDVNQGRPVNKANKFANSEQRISILDPQSSNDVSALSTGIPQILEGFKKLAEDLQARIDPQEAFFPPKETLPVWDCADTLQKTVEGNRARKILNGPRISRVDSELQGTRTKYAERGSRKPERSSQERPSREILPQEASSPAPVVAESTLLPPSMTSKLLQLARARREAKSPNSAPVSGLEQAADERKQRAAQQKSAISADMEMLAGKET